MPKESKKDPGEKRQHTISMPAKMYGIVEEEGRARGLTTGEMARAIWRCWIEGRPVPVRMTGASAIETNVEQQPTENQPQVQFEPKPIVSRAQQPVLVAAPTPATVRKYPQPFEETSSEVFARVVGQGASPQRLPDPDFDSPEALMEAKKILDGAGRSGCPF